MAFKMKVSQAAITPAKQGGKTAKPRKLVSVWDKYKTETLAKLKTAITEAEGRFGTATKNRDPKDEMGASTMWRLVSKPSGGVGEEVAISLKCGSRNKLSIWPKYKRVKVDGVFVKQEVDGEANEIVVGSESAVAVLQDLQKQVKNMKRGDKGLGDLFHAEALAISTQARKKSIAEKKVKYNKDKDAFFNTKTGEPA
jgi:hypothetical protein